MGFGHRVYRAEDPRARVLRRTARELDAPRYEVAEALEQAALAELRERRPDRVLETNVEFWAAIVLDFAEVPAHMFTSMFTCARTGGWSAHILEQKRTGRLIRPSADLHRPGRRARPPRSTAGTTAWAAATPLIAGQSAIVTGGRCRHRSALRPVPCAVDRRQASGRLRDRPCPSRPRRAADRSSALAAGAARRSRDRAPRR